LDGFSHAGGRPLRGPLPANNLSRAKIASSINFLSRRNSASIFGKFMIYFLTIFDYMHATGCAKP
jgi:hypothetical protein